MKLTAPAVLALAGIARVATGFELGHALGSWCQRVDPFFLKGLFDESSLKQRPFQAGNSHVLKLLAGAAEKVGVSLQDIPTDAVDSWRTVLDAAPHLLETIQEKIEDQLRSQLSLKDYAGHYFAGGPKQDSTEWDYVVKNDKFPEHRLRIKTPNELGLDTVKQYSGYLDIDEGDKHFFFWFFESRNDSKNDPLILWLNGGPGCSSLLGLLFESGPGKVDENFKVVTNEYSWNNNASMLYLEQPVNVGFSYSSWPVTDTVAAGKDVYAFLSLFFENFPEYASLPFHMMGESYGGHYVPVFASEILSHEDRIFNISTVLIGNGLTDVLTQYDYYEPMACGKGGYPAVLNETDCQSMLDAQPVCESLISNCYKNQNIWTCTPAEVYCDTKILAPYVATGMNAYDVTKKCEGTNLCYPELEVQDKWLSQDYVRKALGVDESIESHSTCNFGLNYLFRIKGDWMKPFHTKITDLLEARVPTLAFAGDKDFICNWLGVDAWTQNLLWHGHTKFGEQSLEPWTVKGKPAGEYRNYEHFTFLRVYGAGHMVPYDQPEAALDMINRWVAGDRAFD